jgi:quercetin dioxygenase-like cupin family protein
MPEDPVKKPIVCLVVFGALLLALAPQAQAQAKKGSLFQPATDLKWTDLPDFPGVKMAVAEGDPAKGPSHIFIKFEPGFTAPRHHHTSDHYVTVVSGTLVLTTPEGERRLPPGSFFSFTGKTKHATRCEAGAECVLAIDSRGKWDVIPEAGAKAEPKSPQPRQ